MAEVETLVHDEGLMEYNGDTTTTESIDTTGRNVVMANGEVVDNSFKITLPDAENTEELQTLLHSLDNHQSVRGVKMFALRLERYLLHVDLAEQWWERVQTGADFINGVRTNAQKRGTKKKSARATAQAFYESLSTPALRLQCKVFDLNYDSFESVDDVVTALVDKHVELMVQ